MSIIQKLENSYLGILRFFVVAGSGLLLIAAIALGGWSLKGILSQPEPVRENLSVEAGDVLKQVAPEQMKAAQASGQPDAANAGAGMANPAQLAASEKIYAMAAAFIGKFGGNVQTINRNGFFEYLDTKLNQYESEEVRTRYLLGLTNVMDSSFKSLRVNAIAGSPMTVAAVEPGEDAPVVQVNDKPINMVIAIIGSYTELYNKKLEAARARQQVRAEQAQSDRAAALMQLYVAGGLFGLFLLAVFLFIVIRIERNLREITGKPRAAADMNLRRDGQG